MMNNLKNNEVKTQILKNQPSIICKIYIKQWSNKFYKI